MSKSTAELRSIAAAGGGMIIDSSKHSTAELRSIAAAASNKQAQIVITSADKKPTADLRSIAAAGNGCVVFDF